MVGMNFWGPIFGRQIRCYGHEMAVICHWNKVLHILKCLNPTDHNSGLCSVAMEIVVE